MDKLKNLKTWSSKQAVAILAVDNIKLSDFGYKMLQDCENDIITYEEARIQIIERAKNKYSKS